MSTYDIPGASVYGQAVELAKKRYQTRLADINKQRQETLRRAGFVADIDPESGLTSNMRTDPYNKYGGYQMLNRAQALRHDELLGQNLARGIGSRGGLGAQALNDLRFDFGREDADFGSNLTDALSAFTRQQQEEKYAYDEALYQAQLAAAQSAIEGGDFGYGGGDYDDGYDYVEDPVETPKVTPGIRLVSPPRVQTKPKTKPKPAPRRPSVGPGGPGRGGQSAPAKPKPAPKPVPKRPSVKKK